MEITYLKSTRAPNVRNHYEQRLVQGSGWSWWLVYDEGNHKPEHIGEDSNLPKFVREQLSKLRSDPRVGERRMARHIDVSMAFFPGDEHNGIPHDQNVEWLSQYKREVTYKRYGKYDTARAYLVVLDSGNEDYPTQIWEHRWANGNREGNHLDAIYTLVWKRQEENTDIIVIPQPPVKGELTQQEKNIIHRARQIGRYYMDNPTPGQTEALRDAAKRAFKGMPWRGHNDPPDPRR